jgi:hypothetical protein
MNCSSRIISTLFILAVSTLPLFAQETATLNPVAAPTNGSEQMNKAPMPDAGELTTRTTPTAASQDEDKQKPNPPFVFPTRSERFHRYVRSTVGPFSLLNSGFTAGINQWRDKPEEWEQGASGYGKRFASSFGRNAIQQTVIYGLDSAMALDTGFRKSRRQGFGPRLKHALAENVTSRTRSGKRVVSLPRLAGVYTGAFIATEAWYPERYNAKDALRSGTFSLLTGFGLNLVREFIVSW